MKLHLLDLAIVLIYFLAAVVIGMWVSRRGSKDFNSRFPGGKSLPWYLLGISNASGMFDISGTMWLVNTYMRRVYEKLHVRSRVQAIAVYAHLPLGD